MVLNKARQQLAATGKSPRNANVYTQNHEMQPQMQNKNTLLQTSMQRYGSKQKEAPMSQSIRRGMKIAPMA